MKNPFKITQGGVLGRNLKHAIKIKMIAFGILFIAASFNALAFMTSAPTKYNSEQTHANEAAIPAALAVLVAAKFITDGKFKELTGTDLDTFKAEATVEELEIYLKAVGDNKQKKIDEAIAACASKEDIAALRKDFLEFTNNTLVKEVERLAVELKAIKEMPKNKSGASAESIHDQLKANVEALNKLAGEKGASVKLVVKAATTMTTGNVTPSTAGGISMLLNEFEPGITPIPRSQPFFADLFSAVPTSGSTVSYAEMKNPDGGAGMTAEGAAKSQADFDLVEAKVNVRKITAFIKTSKEALSDIAALAGEINGELMILVKLKKDAQVMNGDGTGQNLSGVVTLAEDFTGGDLAGTIPTPNNFDVLASGVAEVMVAEVISGEPAGFMPNVIVLNPVDFVQMKLTKDSQGNYVLPLTLPGVTDVVDVPVVKNPRMTKGEFLIMDTSKGNLRIREDITFDIGYENDDFTKNLVTILAETRVTFYIKSQHTKAFLHGDFESAKELLLLSV